MTDTTLFETIAKFNCTYASYLDENQLESWPDCFVDECFYKVTTAENYQKGRLAGLIYANSKGMLQDRITALREANIYEQHSYRHILSVPLVKSQSDKTLIAETSFLVNRIMRGGQMDIFATGKYVDEFQYVDTDWLLRKRVVVCDSISIDTLLAIPL